MLRFDSSYTKSNNNNQRSTSLYRNGQDNTSSSLRMKLSEPHQSHSRLYNNNNDSDRERYSHRSDSHRHHRNDYSQFDNKYPTKPLKSIDTTRQRSILDDDLYNEKHGRDLQSPSSYRHNHRRRHEENQPDYYTVDSYRSSISKNMNHNNKSHHHYNADPSSFDNLNSLPDKYDKYKHDKNYTLSSSSPPLPPLSSSPTQRSLSSPQPLPLPPPVIHQQNIPINMSYLLRMKKKYKYKITSNISGTRFEIIRQVLEAMGCKVLPDDNFNWYFNLFIIIVTNIKFL
jgi:hypothetical protein